MPVPLDHPAVESFRDILSPTACLRLGLSWAVVTGFQWGGKTWLADPISTPVALVCGSAGVTDLSIYQYEPGADLLPDFFI